jgi:hypothetical protein
VKACTDVLIVVKTRKGYDTYSAFLRDEQEPIVPTGSHDPEREACVALAARGYDGAVRFMRSWNGPASMIFEDLRKTAERVQEKAAKKVPRSRRASPESLRPTLGHAT